MVKTERGVMTVASVASAQFEINFHQVWVFRYLGLALGLLPAA